MEVNFIDLLIIKSFTCKLYDVKKKIMKLNWRIFDPIITPVKYL